MKPAAKGFVSGVVVVIAVLIVFAISIPNLLRVNQHALRPGQVGPFMQRGEVGDEEKTGGGGGGGVYRIAPGTVYASERLIIRNGDMEIAVDDVAGNWERVTALAQQFGGYVERSSLTGAEARSQNAEIILRVPAAKLDEVRAAVRKLAQHVDSDSVEAKDVTREYVDLDARLRNAKASEEQYLAILKRATAVKDIVEVTDKLGEIRGQIEQLQAELKLLSSQIEMSTLTVKLHPVAEAQIAGIYWRPWLNLKSAGRDLGQGLANFADFVVYVVVLLPLIALWAIAIVLALVIVWRLGRFVWKRLLRPRVAGFESPKS